MKFQRKIYLSRAQTRAMAMDHPIGDPTGGPAYGERRDPVSAVIAVATMATTYEAAFAGSVVYGMMFAGAAMNLVGNATGNKNLQLLGGVVGLAGGVGALAGLGEAAATSATATSTSTTSVAEGTDAANTANTANTANAVETTASAAPSASESIVGNANPNVTVNAAPVDAVAPPTPIADTSQAGLIAGNTDKAALLSNSGYGEGMTGAQTSAFDAAAGSGAASNAGGATQVMYDDGSSAMMNADGSFAQGSVQAAPDSAFGYGGPGGTPYTMMDKAKAMLPEWKNMTTMDKLIAAKVGSDVVGGVAHYIAPTKQEKAATDSANAQAALAQAQAAKIAQENALRDQRIANLNRNMQAGLGIGSNQGAVAINQPKPGLIQSQMRVA